MNTEHFLELPTSKGMVTISKSSIAAMEDRQYPNPGVRITLKEKRPDGLNIVFDVDLPYLHLKNELNKYEKVIAP